ncbi:MAG TPA: PLP-dependent transferase, partial [Baekduia sp.]|nr:PLP-dependent transferase [Baekduia sp.]
GPTLAAPYHLAGAVEGEPYGYGRYANPTWSAYEQAIGELEGGEALVLSSGMAGAGAILAQLRPGEIAVLPSDAYNNVRDAARLWSHGVQLRLVPTDERAVREALPGARIVWAETPSNPGLDVLDVAALARDVHAAGALLVVDNTLATPLRQRPLELGADVSVMSASKFLTGHADLVLGCVTARDPELVARLRSWRSTVGAIAGPFEVWLAHRSLATLAVRLERQETAARTVVSALREHPAATHVRWPGVGSVLSFELAGEEAAGRFFAASQLVAEATSFGGVHTSAERRARWGADDVAPGFVRLSCGIEDPDDLVRDVRAALDAAA